jgi:hypothetical protein
MYLGAVEGSRGFIRFLLSASLISRETTGEAVVQSPTPQHIAHPLSYTVPNMVFS